MASRIRSHPPLPEPPAAERYLPLRPVVFAVLLSLELQPRHGYAVMQAVNERLGRTALVGPGTLYRTLKELRDGGLIEPAPGVEASEDERRRYYRPTALGRAVARAEAQRLAGLVEQARRAKLLEGT
jgi:DNA-binding PadR family transcriptional regulator